MSVVDLSSYRQQGGLHVNQIWCERLYPEIYWIITDVFVADNGHRRVVSEPLADRECESTYSESYFRKHFIDYVKLLEKRNKLMLKKAKKKKAEQLLDEMALVNLPEDSPKSSRKQN